MLENMVDGNQISFILVFLEGVLSFFSPCVLPLLPVYMGYLAGSGQRVQADGTVRYERRKVLLHTVFFVLGISAAFFLLGLSFSALGTFFSRHQVLFSRIGGLIIMLLGLVQMGFLEFEALEREHRLRLPFQGRDMNPLLALAMGFTFSFAWTPCVGPMLSSVLIMASGAQSVWLGNALVLLYAVGFVLPFLALGLFTTQLLNFLRGRQQFLRYTVKIGGVILLLMGVMTFTGWGNRLTSYQSTPAAPPQTDQTDTEAEVSRPAFDFTLTDQYGNSHTLADYRGKVVFLNFWATWCGPCQMEMPYIEELYQSYGLNKDEVIFLAVALPDVGREKDVAGIKQFLQEGGYTYPVVFDESGQVFADYQITSYPTTFMIDQNGQRFGYVSGSLTKEMMVNIIEQTINHQRK